MPLLRQPHFHPKGIREQTLCRSEVSLELAFANLQLRAAVIGEVGGFDAEASTFIATLFTKSTFGADSTLANTTPIKRN
jgi:hypothetical protein